MTFVQEGAIIEIFDEQQVSEKFKKREFVIEIPGQYPEQVKFQLVQDKCDLVDGFRLGDTVKISFSLRGRGFNKNGQMLYFNNLEAWKVDATGSTPQPKPNVPAARQPQTARASGNAAPTASDNDNDLPF